MSFEPIQFGAPGREMVGILNRPRSHGDKLPFLLFNPFGQEAIRAAPLFRSLAERLQRAGHLVLRFDYRGTGNSPGDEASLRLGDMVADGLVASERLRLSDERPQLWFGLSLGATVAAMAALTTRLRPRRLILWQPVTDGSDYCQRMIEQHRIELAEELQTNWQDLQSQMAFEEPTVPGHLLGFTVGAELAADLNGLKELPLDALLGTTSSIDCAVDDPSSLNGITYGDRAGWTVLKIIEPINWMAGEAEATALVPRQIADLVLNQENWSPRSS